MADKESFLAAHGPAIEAAARRIAPRVARTPLLRPAALEPLQVKPECVQATGSFKLRGAFNAVLARLEAEPDLAGFATVSSGNHGQAVAYAARAVGRPAVVVMPEQAAAVKRDAVLALGARVVNNGVTTANREARFAEILAETGFTPIHPFDDWDVIHGQGTVGLELAEDLPDLATVAVPLGGGGLISGVATALAYKGVPVRVFGVEPSAADDARRSLQAGRVVERAAGQTIADGALAARIGERTAEVLLTHRLVHDVVTVTDEELERTLPAIWRHTRLQVEPTGALALAAVMLGRVPAAGPTVAVVTGGNVEPGLVVSILSRLQ